MLGMTAAENCLTSYIFRAFIRSLIVRGHLVAHTGRVAMIQMATIFLTVAWQRQRQGMLVTDLALPLDRHHGVGVDKTVDHARTNNDTAIVDRLRGRRSVH